MVVAAFLGRSGLRSSTRGTCGILWGTNNFMRYRLVGMVPLAFSSMFKQADRTYRAFTKAAAPEWTLMFVSSYGLEHHVPVPAPSALSGQRWGQLYGIRCRCILWLMAVPPPLDICTCTRESGGF